MTEQNPIQASPMPLPAPDLKSLDRLVGTWKVSGGTQGQIRYEWMEGGFFLLQHIDLESNGHRIKGIEIIGHVQPFGEQPTTDIKSRFYGNSGETFDYVYEMERDIITIWGGEKGSPAYYRGTLSADGNALNGEWIYPGGGGYQSTAIRVK